MNYIIKKNYKLDDCLNIFNDNHKNFVFDKNSITDKTYTKFVCVDEHDTVLGYAVVYPHNDFLKREEFNCNYFCENDSIYIWHIIVHSKYCNCGVGKTITNAILDEFKGHPIYCAIDTHNIPSLSLHKNLGFEIVDTFTQLFHGTDTTFSLLRHI